MTRSASAVLALALLVAACMSSPESPRPIGPTDPATGAKLWEHDVKLDRSRNYSEVTSRGVSASPPSVTAQMVANFAAGGAAINQIAKAASADLHVVPIDLERPTRDFTEAAAMSADEFLEAVDLGYRTLPDDCDLLAVGEMGRLWMGP